MIAPGAEPPSPEALLTDDSAVARLAGYLVGRQADRTSAVQEGQTARVRLFFDH